MSAVPKTLSNASPVTAGPVVQSAASAEGLTTTEVNQRLAQFGPNELPGKSRNPLLEFCSHFWGVEVDQSALTGESLPVEKKQNDSVYCGSILRKGEMPLVQPQAM